MGLMLTEMASLMIPMTQPLSRGSVVLLAIMRQTLRSQTEQTGLNLALHLEVQSPSI